MLLLSFQDLIFQEQGWTGCKFGRNVAQNNIHTSKFSQRIFCRKDAPQNR